MWKFLLYVAAVIAWSKSTQGVATGCPDGYSYLAHTHMCYRAYARKNTYVQATTICQADGGTLAMPRDGTTNDFLIALKNTANPSTRFYFGLDRRDGSWNYVDGGELSYTDWGAGEPNNEGGDEHCADYLPAAHGVANKKDKWNDAPCSKFAGFICETGPIGCPDGYSYLAHTRMCYRAYDRENTYVQATTICQADGGTLAMPRDGTTNDFLIALKNTANPSTRFYFGLDRRDGSWNYVDGGELSYTDWGVGEPNNEGGDEHCADYLPATHGVANKKDKWNDAPCSKFAGFICETGNIPFE
ncbi:macrophage mannose receptor 1-like [Branchiostoma lanceolatum]|uniref:macrophage mannose receptor 1-like n=1 Tax=Branchiostoma lanceolatum TaxID=7740 RepID=UPI0034564E1B